MKNVNALSTILNVSTVKFVLLDIFTLGFYSAIVLAWKHRDFNEETGSTLFPIDMLIKIVILSGAIDCGLYLIDLLDIAPEIDFSVAANLIVFICWVMFSFKMRDNLVAYMAYQFQFEVKSNSFLLVIFNIYYVVYLINNMEKQYNLKQALAGNNTSVAQ